MVLTSRQSGSGEPFGLAVSGEGEQYVGALRMIVGPAWIRTLPVETDRDVLQVVQTGQADALLLDDEAIDVDALKLLRTIRRMNQTVLVVLLTSHTERRWLEEALRLAAFSVVAKPLRLEEMLVQIHRMMVRLDAVLRNRAP